MPSSAGAIASSGSAAIAAAAARSAVLERAQAALPAFVPGGEAGVAARAGERGEVAEQRRHVLEVEQRGPERLVALQQQVGDAARAGEPRADRLRGGLAVQVVVVADRAA